MKRKPKTVLLVLTEHKGVRLFYHATTERAALEISYFRVPLFSTVELFRGTKSLAKAVATTYGTHAPLEAFHGSPPLITETRYLPKGWSDEIKASSRGLRLGDEILLVLEPASLRHTGDEESSLDAIFRKATHANLAAALREHNERKLMDKISRLVHDTLKDEMACLDFYETHRDKPLHEQLRLAHELNRSRKPAA
jgi:hypothetical protein